MTPPTLVLGIGNRLLGDDAVGLHLLEMLETRYGGRADLEFIDGGTQGLALLGLLASRRRLVLLDAVALGAVPGTIHDLCGRELLASPRHAGATAHSSGAVDLLRAALLIGTLPPDIRVIGIEPQDTHLGLHLSNPVMSGLGHAISATEQWLAAASEQPVPLPA